LPARGFTLIELILVMALLTIAVSMTAPMLSRFFRGRTLESEARRLLALTRHGQSRAASEGLPMDLWVNADKGEFGLKAEPSYENDDPKQVEFQVDPGLRIEVENRVVNVSTNSYNRSRLASIASVPRTLLAQPGLPTIRFLPDGSLGEDSPQLLRLAARDGSSLWLKQSRNRLNYEIKSNPED
jgi:prepilin-type N-terminal cleavage/methylation domain-containing protein